MGRSKNEVGPPESEKRRRIRGRIERREKRIIWREKRIIWRDEEGRGLDLE